MTGRANTSNRYYNGPVTDHFDGRVFFNPEGTPPGKITDLVRWKMNDRRTQWPVRAPSPYPLAVPQARVADDGIRVTHVGHATVLVQTAGINILTDPVWSKRASPFAYAGPRRVNDPGIAFENLPPIDLVLLSHNHYDHLDIATLRRLKREHDPLIVTPLGNDTIIGKSLSAMRVVTGDWGDMMPFGDRLKIHFEPVHHWSARGLGDRRMALWAGFVIEGPAGNIYHVGDTGFHGGRNYREVRQKHGDIRLAILPFGAYEPRWFMKGQHQNPTEAVAGMELCGARHVAGHHWGTFQLTNEGIEEPKLALAEAMERRAISHDRFRPMHPGEVWDVPA